MPKDQVFVKITAMLPEDIVKAVRVRAAKFSKNVKDIIEDALRAYLVVEIGQVKSALKSEGKEAS